MWDSAYESTRYEDTLLKLDFADRFLNYVRTEAPTPLILVETPVRRQWYQRAISLPEIKLKPILLDISIVSII